MHLRLILPALLAVYGAQAAPASVNSLDDFENSFAERDTTSAASSSVFIPASTLETDILAAKALVNLAIYQIENPSSCNVLNAAIRREWSTLSQQERLDYINAELCLMSKPSQDPSFAAGAKTRYDDFVAVHINQTLFIHGTANFLSWHRYFTWAFEQALRNECGYMGYQPYWNWGKYAFDPLNSPLFDGSAYSMSGNGVYEPHNCTEALPTDLNCIPPGSGGGCVNTGPFKDYVVNLGPVSPTLDIPGIINYSNPDPLAYNPRCLRRDISSWVSSNWTKDSDSYDLIPTTMTSCRSKIACRGISPSGFMECIPRGISRLVVTQAATSLPPLENQPSSCTTPRLIVHGGSGKTKASKTDRMQLPVALRSLTLPAAHPENSLTQSTWAAWHPPLRFKM